MLEALGYGVGAVALIVANKVLIPRAFSHGRGVEALPYISERFTIVYLAVALAVAPSIIAMFRIGDAITALTSGNAGQIAVLRRIGLSVGRDSGRHPVHSGEWPRLVMRQSLWRTSRFQYKSVLGSHDPWKPVGEYGEEQRVNLRRRGWVVP